MTSKGASTGIRLVLVGYREWTSVDGRRHRTEQWTISGGEIDPAWRRDADGRERDAGWEPSSRFSLHMVDDEIDPRLASYGGVVWPSAWPDLFQVVREGTYQQAVEITDTGLSFRKAVLRGTSNMHADARILP